MDWIRLTQNKDGNEFLGSMNAGSFLITGRPSQNCLSFREFLDKTEKSGLLLLNYQEWCVWIQEG